MAATSSSSRKPLPLDTLSLSSRANYHYTHLSQHHNLDLQRELFRHPTSLIDHSTLGATYNGHDRFHDRPPASKMNFRKRAASISDDKANKHPRVQNLNFYTSESSKPSAFVGAQEEPRELICLCTKAPKVPRPRNAFILYRQHHQASVAAQHPGLANPDISKLIGEQWREQPEEVKASWKRLAEEEKLRHQRQYPDYRYQPRRSAKNGGSNKLISGGAAGDDTGHCQKCGGRFIATPRTPSTPFGVVTTPAFAKPMAAGLPQSAPVGGGGGGGGGGEGNTAPGSMMHNPNPRVIETDYLMRHGSNASLISADLYGRRYTQPYVRESEDDYSLLSAAGPPLKKQRYSNGAAAASMPVSPSLGHAPHPADPRFSHQSPSASGARESITSFNIGPLPRPLYLQQQGMHYPDYMQPPPRRPSIPYAQAAPAETLSRINGSGFDKSLRLPPLHTQIPDSPSTHSEVNIMTAPTVTQSTGVGIMNLNAPPPRPSFSGDLLSSTQRPQWLFRLDMLRAICPPLQAPRPEEPPFEVRGPIIALEGAPSNVLREVAVLVEKALLASGECAVQLWDDFKPNGAVDRESSGTSNGGDAQTFTNPIARFQERMLKWHRTSDELVEYITRHPSPGSRKLSGGMEPDRSSSSSSSSSATNLSASSTVSNPYLLPLKLPVALFSTGYSLAVTDREAAALRIADAYRPEDHWRWVATMWRGIVGPDLTVYVKQCAEDEMMVSQAVDFASPGVLVVRVPVRTGDGDEPDVWDEKLERRLGFEILEWVRVGQFGRRSF